MAHDVFISYSSKDKPTADAVCATLESRGVRCWIAPRDVLPGEEYAASIVNAIHSARLTVLVFSSGANQSPQVLREVERAVSRGLPILPLRIENVAPSASMEYYISSRHWLDALTEPLERHLVQLAETVKLLLSRVPVETTPEPIPMAVKPIPATVVDPPKMEVAQSPVAHVSEPEPDPAPTNKPPSPQVAAKPTPTPAPKRVAKIAPVTVPGRSSAATAALIMQVMLGGYYVGTMSSGEFSRFFHWSTAQMLPIFSASALAFGAGCIAAGLWMRGSPPRTIALAGAILLGGGFFLASAAGMFGEYVSLWWFALTYGLVAGFGLGLCYLSSLITLLRWFPDKRGWMMGLAGAFFALGTQGLAIPLLGLIRLFGLQSSFAGLGVLFLIVLIPAARALQEPPTQGMPQDSTVLTLPEALHRWGWYALWGIQFLNGLVGGSLLILASIRSRQIGANNVNGLLFAASVGAIAGPLLWGAFSDRIGRRSAFILLLGLEAAFIMALSVLHDAGAFGLLVFSAMFCYAGARALLPAFTADCFGSQFIGPIYGVMMTATSLATLLCSLVFAPASRGDDAATVLFSLAVLIFAGSALAFSIRRAAISSPTIHAQTASS